MTNKEKIFQQFRVIVSGNSFAIADTPHSKTVAATGIIYCYFRNSHNRCKHFLSLS